VSPDRINGWSHRTEFHIGANAGLQVNPEKTEPA